MKLEPEPKMLDFQCSVIPGCWSSAWRDLPCCSALGWVSSSWDSWLLLHLQHLQHTTSLEAWPAPTAVQFSSVQSLSCVQLFVTPWNTARQASLSITNSQSPPKLMSIESVMPSNHLILCHPLLLLPSIFPSIRVFFKWVSSLHPHQWSTYADSTNAKSLQLCLTLCDPIGRSPPGSSVPLSMGFSRQEYWSGLPFLSPGDLPDPEVEPTSPVFPALTGRFFNTKGVKGIHLGSPQGKYQPKVYIWQGRFSLIFSLLLPQHLLPTKLVCFSCVIVILYSAFCYYTNKIFCQYYI